MSNDFFNNHPMLGSVFDFNHDGSMNLGEAGAMAALGSMAASELMRASEESVREQNYDQEPAGWGMRFPDSDDFDDEYEEYDDSQVYDVDTSDVDEVMAAVMSGDFDEADIEYLVRGALCAGVRFDRDDLEDILEHIQERDLRDWVESFLD